MSKTRAIGYFPTDVIACIRGSVHYAGAQSQADWLSHMASSGTASGCPQAQPTTVFWRTSARLSAIYCFDLSSSKIYLAQNSISLQSLNLFLLSRDFQVEVLLLFRDVKRQRLVVSSHQGLGSSLQQSLGGREGILN